MYIPIYFGMLSMLCVKAKYVFYTEDSMKKKKEETCPTHCNNVYVTFVIVFYADCASTQYCVKHRILF